MKKIYVYYSLTGNVKRHVEENEGDTYEIKALKSLPKSKFMQMVILGYKSSRNKKIEVQKCDINFDEYDKVVLCFPVWSGKIANPMRSFLEENYIKNKSVDLLISCGGSTGGVENTVVNYIDPSNTIDEITIFKERKSK